MVDWATVVLSGFAMGIGSETSKVIHELYIKPKILKLKEQVDKLPSEIQRIQVETKGEDNVDRVLREELGKNP
jgi:hypothetical protein